MFHKDIEAVAARNFEAAGDEGDPQDDQQLLQAMSVINFKSAQRDIDSSNRDSVTEHFEDAILGSHLLLQ